MLNLFNNLEFGLFPGSDKFTLNTIEQLTVRDLLDSCKKSSILRDQVYIILTDFLLTSDNEFLEKPLERMTFKKLFSDYTDSEGWLLLFTLLQLDFSLMLRLYNNQELYEMFDKKFSRISRQKKIHSKYYNVFMLIETYNQYSYRAGDITMLYNVCKKNKRVFPSLINNCINSTRIKKANEAYEYIDLDNEIKKAKPSNVRLFIAKLVYLFIRLDWAENIILLDKACSKMAEIIKTRPYLELIPLRRFLLPTSKSPSASPCFDSPASSLTITKEITNNFFTDKSPDNSSSSEEDSPLDTTLEY